jgi:uncharacterized protein YdaU (DUF1376 family)
MAKADIWMPFYVSDYLADTMHLTPAEHGAYLMLILHYWKSGPLPDDDVRLALISRMGDAWSNASSTLRAFFKQSSGMLHHTRIDKERADAVDNKARNQARASAAASKRWGNHASSNATSIPQAMLNECPSPSPSPSQLPKTVVTAAKRRTQLPGDFYPNESGVSKSEEKGLSLAIELTKFSDYHRGKGSVMADWQAAWRTWIGNARPPTSTQTETAYQRSMRERVDQAIGRNRVYEPDPQFLEIEQ